LQGYDWPGNVRELRNVIERAVILARGGTLSFDLPVTGSGGNDPHSALGTKAGPGVPQKILTEAELQSLERQNLVAALQATNWKIRGQNGAAELLGVKPTTLYSRMQKFGITPPTSELG
jgi:transcriptional regulator with GAF, ATPase, and Fis domain